MRTEPDSRTRTTMDGHGDDGLTLTDGRRWTDTDGRNSADMDGRTDKDEVGRNWTNTDGIDPSVGRIRTDGVPFRHGPKRADGDTGLTRTDLDGRTEQPEGYGRTDLTDRRETDMGGRKERDGHRRARTDERTESEDQDGTESTDTDEIDPSVRHGRMRTDGRNWMDTKVGPIRTDSHRRSDRTGWTRMVGRTRTNPDGRTEQDGR